ncbi:hypothetical protein O3M35_010487 [Rhynocoris fuscipes]|uniref:Tudor domain-containing protein n=1 Tax=Rhynocoris fuscipes TaxID=488301 RepID=A0AAW1D1C2_9HEMI
MLFGKSQLLLAGIPTGAALIGLLWLKRRRSTLPLHHTDPGGSILEEKVKIIEELKEEEDKSINLEEVSSTTIDEHSDSLKENQVLVESIVTSNFVETGNCITEVSTENCGKIEEKSEENQVITNIADNLEVEENNLVENSIEEVIAEDKQVLNNSVEFIVESEKEISVEKQEDIITEEITKQKEEAEEESEEINKNPILEVSKKTDIIEVEEEKKKESEEPEAIQEEILEEVIKKPEEGVKKNIEKESVEEEGAVGNMKTGPTELAEKLASLELDTMKIREENVEGDQKVCSERDSANHSPSEVMLASPSISNFSDAHSEGSSDSGKGHSDVATSPSRTPAGGSSLAGDHAPSIYEFVLPQVIVGRLIGRRGTFLHEIRSSTQTNIYIKRHPDTDKLKICAIEGSQQDIDKALAKIRQKFPLRRFPQLTLEKVSFVTINPLPPLKLEDFHLQLVEGVNNDVILSSLITAAHFFLQQPSHPSYSSLGSLNHVMNQVYSSCEAPCLETPIKDAVCAAPTMGGWYRAQIINLDEEAGTSTVRFLDYGGYLTLDSSNLRQIRADLLALPFQAVECYLANVAPAEEEGWSEEARIFVHNATVGQILQAQIYDYAEDGTPLVYLYASYGSQVILINEELVMRGYGILTSVPEE